MRILIVKTSSLGDVIHTLPALTDLSHFHPTIECDWVIEESLADILKLHPFVKKIIPVALRRWRRNPLNTLFNLEWLGMLKQLRETRYDLIIDAQGLIKSASLARLAKGIRYGFDKNCAREPLASFMYQHHFNIPKNKHALTRIRMLFSTIFNYSLPDSLPDYGIASSFKPTHAKHEKYIVFLHGTTWATKHWPEHYWLELAALAEQEHYAIKLPWGNTAEYERACKIAEDINAVSVLPKASLAQIANIIANAHAVIGVDTGLSHLAAALAVPTLTLYGPTNPSFTGTWGINQKHLIAQFECAPCLQKKCHYEGPRLIEPPCFKSLTPPAVWQHCLKLINDHENNEKNK